MAPVGLLVISLWRWNLGNWVYQGLVENYWDFCCESKAALWQLVLIISTSATVAWLESTRKPQPLPKKRCIGNIPRIFLHVQTDLPFNADSWVDFPLGTVPNLHCLKHFRLTLAKMQYSVSPIAIVCVDGRNLFKTRLNTKTLISDQKSQDWSLDRPSCRCLSLGYSLPSTSFNHLSPQQDRPVPPKLSDDWGPCAWTKW